MAEAQKNNGFADFVIFLISITLLSFCAYDLAGIGPAAGVAGLMFSIHDLLSWRLAFLMIRRPNVAD